jgi:peptidoglycan L-alanyl-D-glutamate endopeptidase CwlK
VSKVHVMEAQRLLEVKTDGDFGSQSLAALQRRLGVVVMEPRVGLMDKPMASSWDERSKKAFVDVHPDLLKIVERARAICPFKFIATCGKRTLAEQKVLVAAGASRTLDSRHIPSDNGFSHAIDLAIYVDLDKDGKIELVEMYDWPNMTALAGYMKQAARELNIPLEWGGDWKSFKDGPHYQLPKKLYP